VISQLDLVVTVDTAVAHLAGALGKPVWILLPLVGDFRWLTKRDDSPWYPTARLFRQQHRGDWDDVVARIRDALSEGMAAPVAASAVPKRPNAESSPMPRDTYTPPNIPRIAGLSAVTETRIGILQYFPDDQPMGPSLEWYGEWLQPQLEMVLR